MDSKRKHRNRRMDVVIMSNESLLVQILARLPCRDAVRFKLVCKRWCSLISSDYFITYFVHLHHRPIHDSISPSPTTYKLAFQLKTLGSELYDYSLLVHCKRSTTHRVVSWLDLSFLPSPHEIYVRASCDDLILCCDNGDLTYALDLCNSQTNNIANQLYLCNPQTKQYVALPCASPPPNRHFRDFAVGLLCHPSSCSFCHNNQGGGCRGVDNSRYKFMVMRIHIPTTMTMMTMKPITEFQVQLFSSEEGEWRNYAVSSSGRGWNLCYQHIESLVPYKGKLHWLNYPFILVFDPYNAPGQVCRVIDLPFGSYAPRRKLHSFGVFNDRLCVAYTDPQEMCHLIWELEDYDNGEWVLMQKLDRGGLSARSYVLPGDGNVVCFERYSSAIWLCNFQSDGVMDENKCELIPRTHLKMSSNVSCFQIADKCWPTPIPSLQPRP